MACETGSPATTLADRLSRKVAVFLLRCALLPGLLTAAAFTTVQPCLLAQGPGGHPPPVPGSAGGPGGPASGNPGARNMAPNLAGAGATSSASRFSGPGGRWWDNNNYAHSVGLTTDQQRRMDALFQENRSALVGGLDNLRKAQARLDAVSATGNPSEPAVLAEIQNVAQARADLDKTYTHMTLQIRHEMTDDQLNKLGKLK